MSTGIKQKCRLFLEGREVPFVSATLMCNVGEPIVALIDLVPASAIKFILPKTQVHLFVQDSFNFGDNNFYLAFEGEVNGRHMGKSQDSRTFRIQASDYSEYWSEAKSYYASQNFVIGKFTDVLTGGTPPKEEAKAGGSDIKYAGGSLNSYLITLLTDKKLKGDIVKGVINVINNLSKINLSYKSAWDRLRINDRIRFFTSGNIGKFLGTLQIDEFMGSFTGAQGGLVSIREMLLSVMGLVFHDFVSVPFPSRVAMTTTSGGTKVKVGETVGNFVFTPDAYNLPPPRCNVIFPNQIVSFDFGEDFRAAPTRFAYRASFPAYVAGQLQANTYPVQYYPTSFSDYMTHRATETEAESTSLLGSSTLLKDKDGKSYGAKEEALGFGKSSKKGAVGGSAIGATLKEADFLTNEESIRGIFLDMEVLASGMNTLTKSVAASSRIAFTQEIGKYLFFKKRYGSRNASATLMFHPFLVPGFNCLLVDDSDSGQTVMAKVQSITHNLTHQGCSTSVSLGYARDFDEVDALTGDAGDPPLPAWFDKELFGIKANDTTSKPPKKSEEAKTAYDNETKFLSGALKGGIKAITDSEIDRRAKIVNPVCYTKLSDFYQELIGCDAVTNLNGEDDVSVNSKLCTTRGAAYYLTQKYRQVALQPNQRDTFVVSWIERDVPTLADTFFFLGAEPEGGGVIPDEFAKFVASKNELFDGSTSDKDILALRREVIDAYVLQLQQNRGFRG